MAPDNDSSHRVAPVGQAQPPGSAADPQPVCPPEPDAADCCGEGCVRCIFDIHDQAMERYREALAAWHQRHPDETSPDPRHGPL